MHRAPAAAAAPGPGAVHRFSPPTSQFGRTAAWEDPFDNWRGDHWLGSEDWGPAALYALMTSAYGGIRVKPRRLHGAPRQFGTTFKVGDFTAAGAPRE